MSTVNWDETPEEKSARIQEILRKHIQEPLICITCGESIVDRQTAIKSIHGHYHGPPMTCVNGRQELPWWQN